MTDIEMLDGLRDLMKQVDDLCNSVTIENKKIELEIEETKKNHYREMYQDVKPYIDIYREMYEKYGDGTAIYIRMDKPVPFLNHGEPDQYLLEVVFHVGEFYLCSKRFESDGLSMNMITNGGKLLRYSDGYLGITEKVSKVWFDDYSEEMKKKFMQQVQKILTRRTQKVSDKNKELKRKLGATI